MMTSNEEAALNKNKPSTSVFPKIECGNNSRDDATPAEVRAKEERKMKSDNLKSKLNNLLFSLNLPKLGDYSNYTDSDLLDALLSQDHDSGSSSPYLSEADEDECPSSSKTNTTTVEMADAQAEEVPFMGRTFTCRDLSRTDDGAFLCMVCTYTAKRSAGVVAHMAYNHPEYTYERLITKQWESRAKNGGGLGLRKYTSLELSDPDPNKKLEYETSDLERENLKYKCLCCSYAAFNTQTMHEHIKRQHPKFVHKPRRLSRKPRLGSGLGLKTGGEPTNSQSAILPGTTIWPEADISNPNKELVYTSLDLKQPNGSFKCFCCPHESRYSVNVVRHIRSFHPSPRIVFRNLRRSTIHKWGAGGQHAEKIAKGSKKKKGEDLLPTEPEFVDVVADEGHTVSPDRLGTCNDLLESFVTSEVGQDLYGINFGEEGALEENPLFGLSAGDTKVLVKEELDAEFSAS